MPRVDENRLKGNYATSYVTSRLASQCLVRAVSGDTDVGIDLYCETVQDGQPFLHFWLQVKSGSTCYVDSGKQTASYQFETRHLEYWSRQPVPVYAALVPIGWPVKKDPDIYIVDLTLRALAFGIPNQLSVKYDSDYIWPAGDHDSIERFIQNIVPANTARMDIRKGLVGSIPNISLKYDNEVPYIPVIPI